MNMFKDFKIGDIAIVNKGSHKGYIGVVRDIDTLKTLSEDFWETGVRSYEFHQMVNLEGLDNWFGEGMVDKY